MEMAGNKMLPLLKKRTTNELASQNIQFVEAIKSYQNNMFRLSKSILRNDHDAMDAVGEAILKAYSKLASLRSFDSFKPWIMKIVVNEAYSIAKKRTKFDYLSDIETNEANTTITANSSGVVNPFDSSSSGLWEIVNDLSDEFRVVVVLFYYEDMSIKDIAKAIGISSGTVKSRLSRARQKLKTAMEFDRRIL